jgi:asparagine synthase (glutamine-hydrolysing)
MVLAATNAKPVFVTPDSSAFINDLDKLCWHQEEPFLSASIYVQYCVMKSAKDAGVTVLLDGQGADEILAGYHHFYPPFFNELNKTDKAIFAQQRQAYEQLHAQNPINAISKKNLRQAIRTHFPNWINTAKKYKIKWDQFSNNGLNKDFFNENYKSLYNSPEYDFSNLNESLASYTTKYGLQQLLRYADRNSMAHSREVRLPFLSHELVDFLFTLPATMKMNNGWTKWLMRETFSILPDNIRWRLDKIGYEPPQKNWMEDTIVVEKIRAAKEALVKERFLNKKILDKKIVAEEVGDYKGNSWTYLMAGKLFDSV